MGKTRILLIEDNRLLREGIASLLEEQGDFEVIARSENGDELSLIGSGSKERSKYGYVR